MTTITYTLPGFPAINQLAEPTVDGAADENARMNCVAASLAAALAYLTGRRYDGDQLKDAVYGQGYAGPMDAAHFAGYCARLGVRLAPFAGTGEQLVAHLHEQVEARHAPALVTMPSQWAYAPSDPLHPSGWTHVGVACGGGPGWLRIMNPWGGFWQDQPDGWWAPRLCYGAVWDLTTIPAETVQAQEAQRVVNTTGLLPGMAAAAEARGSDVAIPETWIGKQSYATLADGTVLFWDGQQVHTDKAATVVALLRDALAAAKATPVPAQPGALLDLPTLTAKAQMWDAAALVFGKLVGK